MKTSKRAKSAGHLETLRAAANAAARKHGLLLWETDLAHQEYRNAAQALQDYEAKVGREAASRVGVHKNVIERIAALGISDGEAREADRMRAEAAEKKGTR